MGYTTDFNGSFSLDKPLSLPHLRYLKKFAEIRHMKWNPEKMEEKNPSLREEVGLPRGKHGEFCVGEFCVGASGLIDNNNSGNCPSLWCQWVPTEDGTEIEWDGGEKFYEYTKWLKFIIENFLEPWGYKLNGEVEWCGEDANDRGVIYCKDNVVEAVVSEIHNRGPSWKK